VEIWNYDTPGPDCDGCFLASLRITCAVADLGSLDHSYPGYRREKRGGGCLKCIFLSNIFFPAYRWFIAVTDIYLSIQCTSHLPSRSGGKDNRE